MGFFTDVLEELKESPDLITPSTTTLIKKIPHADLRALFRAGYADKNVARRAATSVINAVYTGKKYAFVLSRQTVISICSNDKNLTADKRTMGHHRNYSAVLAVLLKTFQIKVEIEGVGRRPMLLTVENPELRSAMNLDLGEELMRKQIEEGIRFINKIDKITGKRIWFGTESGTANGT